MTPEAYKSLEQWLYRRFAATTAYQTLVDLKHLEAHPDVAISESQRFSAKRVIRWALETGADPTGWQALLERTPPKAAAPGARKLEARSFEPADWQALRVRLAASERLEDRLLELAQLTGLRAGDVLRIQRAALSAAVLGGEPLTVVAKGGRRRRLLLGDGALYEAVSKLHDQLAGMGFEQGTLAEALVPASARRKRPKATHPRHPYQAAYQRLRRRLQELGEELETDGRLHTHRLRRTAAVAALRSGVDLATVQQLLGHSSLATTSKYLDEDRAEDVAVAMDRFHEQLGGKTR